MSSSLAGPALKPDPFNSVSKVPTRCGLLFAFATLAHVPLLWIHYTTVFQSHPQYNFIPIVFLVAAFLVRKRWIPRTSEKLSSGAVLLLGLDLLFLAAAMFTWSPWLANVALLFCLAAAIAQFSSPASHRDLFPCWLLIWCTIPLPLNIDGKLIRGLQSATSHIGEGILNLCPVMFVREGNVFRIPGHDLFVAEACSGFSNQLLLITLAVILSVCCRRTLLHCLLLTACSVLWAIATNVVRVCTIVYLASSGDGPPAPWLHEGIGLAFLLLGAMGIMSTDSFLRLVLGPIDPASVDSVVTEMGLRPTEWRDSVFIQQWNRWTDNELAATPLVIGDRLKTLFYSSINASGIAFYCVCTMFLFLGSISVWVASAAPSVRTAPTAEEFVDGLNGTIHQATMPKTAGNWKLSNYSNAIPEGEEKLPSHSHIWSYSGSEDHLRVAVEYPFHGWHELTRCYEGTGWTTTHREVIHHADGRACIQAMLRGTQGQYGVLFFALHSADGLLLPPSLSEGLMIRLKRSPLLSVVGGRSLMQEREPSSQIQQLCHRSTPFTQTEVDGLRTAFWDFQQSFLSSRAASRQASADSQ